MATLLESVGVFTDVFDFFLPFLLTMVVSFGILAKTKMLSERADVNAVVSLALAFIVVLSGAGKFLTTITPLFAVFFIIIFFIFLLFMFFGVEKDIKTVLFENRAIGMLILFISLIFVFYAVGTLYGGGLYQPGGDPSVGAGVNATVDQAEPIGPEVCDFSRVTGSLAVSCLLGHPKVLGTLVLLGLMFVATFFLVYIPRK